MLQVNCRCTQFFLLDISVQILACAIVQWAIQRAGADGHLTEVVIVNKKPAKNVVQIPSRTYAPCQRPRVTAGHPVEVWPLGHLAAAGTLGSVEDLAGSTLKAAPPRPCRPRLARKVHSHAVMDPL